MRQALGVAVFGGMIGVTVFGIFLTPVFFAIVDRLKDGADFLAPARSWPCPPRRCTPCKLKFVPPLAVLAKDVMQAGARYVRSRKPTQPDRDARDEVVRLEPSPW